MEEKVEIIFRLEEKKNLTASEKKEITGKTCQITFKYNNPDDTQDELQDFTGVILSVAGYSDEILVNFSENNYLRLNDGTWCLESDDFQIDYKICDIEKIEVFKN